MSLSVCIAADTLDYPTGGGHLWAYLNWALGLRSLGCDVIWMEGWTDGGAPALVEMLTTRLAAFGLDRVCLFSDDGTSPQLDRAALVPVEQAASADLLLNLGYEMPRALLSRFARSALLDIDPGMTQTWFAEEEFDLGPHDIYLTTGEGVARGRLPVADCGVRWLYVPPCVSGEAWGVAPAPAAGAYTTVTLWWAGGEFELPDGELIDNTKRAGLLPYLALPELAGTQLELAVTDDDLSDDAALLRAHGWRLVDPVQAAGTPERYRSYIARSRGEFSCAKPAYVALCSGWISDRTVCYLATGRPAIVQYTGPCQALGDAEGEGVFRFDTPARAVAALKAAERDYPRQCALARALAEERFEARVSAARVLELCLS